jgi:hypothetical protein
LVGEIAPPRQLNLLASSPHKTLEVSDSILALLCVLLVQAFNDIAFGSSDSYVRHDFQKKEITNDAKY